MTLPDDVRALQKAALAELQGARPRFLKDPAAYFYGGVTP